MANSKHVLVATKGSFGGARIIQALEAKDQALKARELAKLLGVTRQQIYKMAAEGALPSFRVGTSVRFDPQQVADWLEAKMPQRVPINTQERLAV